MSSSMSVEEFIARQPRYNANRRIIHWILRTVGFAICKIEVKGLENIPKSGPTLLTMNHISYIDPVVVTAVVRDRYVVAMAKAEAARNPIIRWFIQLWGNYLIRRGEVDRTALNNTIELLRSDQLVLIAPEGTRNPDGLREPRDGAAYIAAKALPVIVPVALYGAQDWMQRFKRLRRAYAGVSIGRPFRLKINPDERLSREARRTIAREIMYQIAMAMPEEQAALRGDFGDLDQATTQYIEFI